MSTATLQRVALPEGFTEHVMEAHNRDRLGWDRYFQFTLQRGATEWRVCFMFSSGPLHERMVLDDEPPFHRPVVHVWKRSGYREVFVLPDDAPLYVQKFIEQHIWTVAEYEQNRHGVPPMTIAEWRAAQAREEAEQRRLVELVARDVRDVAQCGTANSEAIAAWILEKFVERAVHDDVIAEHKELLQEIAAERKDEHAEIIDELNIAIDIATDAQEALGAMDACIDTLDGPRPLEFAYGATEADRIKDVLSDGISAIRAHIWNPKHGDLPEKREIK